MAPDSKRVMSVLGSMIAVIAMTAISARSTYNRSSLERHLEVCHLG